MVTNYSFMVSILEKISAIVDNDCRLQLTAAGKKKIQDLLDAEVINKSELTELVYNTPNDIELGGKIRTQLIKEGKI